MKTFQGDLREGGRNALFFFFFAEFVFKYGAGFGGGIKLIQKNLFFLSLLLRI